VLGNVVRHAQGLWSASRGKYGFRATPASSSEEVIRLEPAGRRLPERRSAAAQTGSLKGNLSVLLSAPTGSGVAVNEGSALGVAAVLSCVSLLADMVAKLPVELFQSTKSGPKPVTRHPAINLLTRPSDRHTAFELRQLMMIGKNLGGNGYARVFRNSSFEPSAIEWLEPCFVRPRLITRRGGNSFIAYDYKGDTLTRGDIIHIRGISRDGVTGISPITLLRESIGTALSQTSAAGKLMANGAKWPGFMTVEGVNKKEQLEDIRDEVNNSMTGAMNAGRIPVVGGAMKFTQTNGMSMVDAQFVESRRFELQEIARHFRIPPFMIGDSTASTTWGTGIEQQTLGFLNFCLDPHIIAFEQALAATLLTSEELSKGYYFRFDRDELASVSRQDTAAYFQTMRGIGVYSVNDVRRKLDEPTIPAESGGDDYSLPFNNTGGAAQAKAAEAPPPEPAPTT
jgi:HK97 family phage portal protein